jgi:hypothetical protein
MASAGKLRAEASSRHERFLKDGIFTERRGGGEEIRKVRQTNLAVLQVLVIPSSERDQAAAGSKDVNKPRFLRTVKCRAHESLMQETRALELIRKVVLSRPITIC